MLITSDLNQKFDDLIKFVRSEVELLKDTNKLIIQVNPSNSDLS